MLQKEQVFPGIWVYKNIVNSDIIEIVEKHIEENEQSNWQEALVGYAQKIPEYRDCVDFKIQEWPEMPNMPESRKKLNQIWKYAYDQQLPAVEDYCKYYSIKMEYWEAMNFVKYGPGQHFQEHADHGFSYYATVSLVSYPNDNYEGGELYFPKIGVTIKPEAGDTVIFPSTYLFSHRAMPVKSGVKYSIVTMLDYNDNAHNPEFDMLRAKRQNIQIPGEVSSY